MSVQLIYASRANFAPQAAVGGVEPTVGRILQSSKRNNAKRGIGGALYYRDGAFLQVLEGPKESVQALLQTLRQDPRHRDVTVLHQASVSRRSFNRWSMKYTALDKRVNQWLSEQKIPVFDPLTFSAEQAAQFADLLRRAEESNLGPQPQTDRAEQRSSVLAIAMALGLTSMVLLVALYYSFF